MFQPLLTLSCFFCSGPLFCLSPRSRLGFDSVDPRVQFLQGNKLSHLLALLVLVAIEIAAFRLDASPLHRRRNRAKMHRGHTRYSLCGQTAGIDALAVPGALQGLIG